MDFCYEIRTHMQMELSGLNGIDAKVALVQAMSDASEKDNGVPFQKHAPSSRKAFKGKSFERSYIMNQQNYWLRSAATFQVQSFL